MCMDIQTQKELAALTTHFYAEQATSFSDTRHAAWPGWESVVNLVEAERPGDSLRVLDVGCGNMRFERYLDEALAARQLAFDTIDNCAALIPSDLPAEKITYHEQDIVSSLIEGDDPLVYFAGTFDVAVSFGVLHHVPAEENRKALLQGLLNSVKPGGLVAVSLWRFMDVPALAQKALETLEFARADASLPASLRKQLDALAQQNDYLVGWQNKPGAYRYCHSFTDADVDALVAAVADKATLIERFCADGRTGDANEYLVFKRLE